MLLEPFSNQRLGRILNPVCAWARACQTDERESEKEQSLPLKCSVVYWAVFFFTASEFHRDSGVQHACSFPSVLFLRTCSSSFCSHLSFSSFGGCSSVSARQALCKACTFRSASFQAVVLRVLCARLNKRKESGWWRIWCQTWRSLPLTF